MCEIPDEEIDEFFLEANEPAGFYNIGKDFTSLECWQNARKVKLLIFNKVLSKLPVEQKFQLGSQLRDAIVSITANMAEGYGRFYYKEGIKFYRISRGSLFELKDHLISCLDFGYIEIHLYKKGVDLIEQAKISLNGYIKYLKNKLNDK